MTTALILAGHGSHISPNTAGIVWQFVDELRRLGMADEVTAAFWKEAPAFNQVINTVRSNQVVVVPVFTAKGYYSTQVIPREMNLQGDVTVRDGKTIYYTRTIGEHAYLKEVVCKRVQDALAQDDLDPVQTAVAVIGHGTQRNPESRLTTRQQAEYIRQQGLVAQVVDVYLDDEPSIPRIYETTDAANVIAVPFFLADGSHTTMDVPEALGIKYGDYPAAVDGRQVFYTQPVGTDLAMTQVILELARESGLSFEPQPRTDVWRGLPSAGWIDLMRTVQAKRDFEFGQLRLSTLKVEPSNVRSEPAILTSPAQLRDFVRTSPFRPHATSTDLPDNWSIEIDTPEQIQAVVETVYPGAVADWVNYQHGEFESISTDKYTPEAIQSICSQCIREPTWFEDTGKEEIIPCKAPCNWFVSKVKEE
jgi:sirohydrochlorin cobaltochelatase